MAMKKSNENLKKKVIKYRSKFEMKVEQSKINRRLVDSNYQFYSQQPDALANCATEADFTEAQPKLSPKSSFKTRAACIDAISSRQS